MNHKMPWWFYFERMGLALLALGILVVASGLLDLFPKSCPATTGSTTMVTVAPIAW